MRRLCTVAPLYTCISHTCVHVLCDFALRLFCVDVMQHGVVWCGVVCVCGVCVCVCFKFAFHTGFAVGCFLCEILDYSLRCNK